MEKDILPTARLLPEGNIAEPVPVIGAVGIIGDEA